LARLNLFFYRYQQWGAPHEREGTMLITKESKIAVLLGGLSGEREVSLKTGRAALLALERLGYRNVHEIDVGADIAKVLLAKEIEVAYIALHGKYGEDGCIQGLLEMMKIPYTGCGVLASAMCMNKIISKKLCQQAAIPLPDFIVLEKQNWADSRAIPTLPFPYPVVVKPSSEGSSLGVSIVKDQEQIIPALEGAFSYDRFVLIEQYIAGRELSVGVVDHQPLGVVEIIPALEFYSYQAKYQDKSTRYICPAQISPETEAALKRYAEAAHRLMYCEGGTRVDFLLDAAGRIFFLEVNTLPGMTEASLLPKIAASRGMGFDALVENILQSARLKIAL
jgi:D-alanine-D-alanine ligase